MSCIQDLGTDTDKGNFRYTINISKDKGILVLIYSCQGRQYSGKENNGNLQLLSARLTVT